MSILEGGSLIKKVYFPREIIPISIVAVNLILFLLTMFLVIIALPFFHVRFDAGLALLPCAVLLQVLLISGINLMVAGLQVRYRDVKYMVEIGLLSWFYLTPIFYPLSLVAEMSDWVLRLYLLNPLTGIITMYRIALLGGYAANIPSQVNLMWLFLYTALVCFFVCVVGFLVFRRQEPQFADHVS
jgi:ABC-2 type transport system permease protein